MVVTERDRSEEQVLYQGLLQAWYSYVETKHKGVIPKVIDDERTIKLSLVPGIAEELTGLRELMPGTSDANVYVEGCSRQGVLVGMDQFLRNHPWFKEILPESVDEFLESLGLNQRRRALLNNMVTPEIAASSYFHLEILVSDQWREHEDPTPMSQHCYLFFQNKDGVKGIMMRYTEPTGREAQVTDVLDLREVNSKEIALITGVLQQVRGESPKV